MSFAADTHHLRFAGTQAEFLEKLTTAFEAEQAEEALPARHQRIIRIIDPEPDAGLSKLPAVRDITLHGDRSIMDLALFRLTKKHKLAHTTMTYAFANGHIEVSSAVNGMASVWDYDLVLLVVSHLVEAMSLHHNGKAPQPGRVLRVSIKAALHFCHRSLGGGHLQALADALQRLGTTRIRQVCQDEGMPVVILDEPLIGAFQILACPRTGKAMYLELTVAEWMYQEVLKDSPSSVSTFNPAYFRITSGIGRFLYRLARHVAGNRSALCRFQTLYACSGSLGSRNEFNRILRALIQVNDLPDYLLSEEEGKASMMLRVVHRSRLSRSGGKRARI